MRVMPRSLFGRLLATAALALVVTLAFATFAIGHVLERFVMHGLDERLDAQIMVVARAVRPDGGLDRSLAVDVPPFDVPGSGWAWEIHAPGGRLQSGSGLPIEPRATMSAGPDHGPWRRWRHHDADRPRAFEWHDARGRPLHGRLLSIATAQGEATVLATGPRSVVDRPIRAALAPLLLSLLLLGGGLSVAIVVQLRIGLRPLGTLRAMLADVRAGRRTHVDAREPRELVPLVEELNRLIDANHLALKQARGHLANLAHGLKTPLAALRLDLVDGGADPEGRLTRQVDRIDAHIRHHLGRARAASPGAGGRTATAVAPHVVDLVAALGRIHAGRAIGAEIAVADDLLVACDPQDLDEMLGNLLDNGWRWARAQVAISAAREGRMVAIRIVDDGPGIADALIASALEPGRRLDESGEGHGFGLAIARELAELYGGSLTLANGRHGGLVATLSLPVPPLDESASSLER